MQIADIISTFLLSHARQFFPAEKKSVRIDLSHNQKGHQENDFLHG